MSDSILDTIDRLHGDDALSIEQAATRHRLDSWVLPGLIGLEHARVGRFGAGGITAKLIEALEAAAEGQPPPESVRAGSVQGLGPAEQTELVAIELQWFRQFQKVRIEFLRDPGRPICLIEGRNGYGKTHLVEALRLALIDDRRTDLDELLNRWVPDTLETATATVVVELLSTAERRIRVRKAISFRRGSDGAWKKPASPDLTVEADSLAQPLQDRAAEEWLRQRFPPEVLNYFIFDAESTVVSSLSAQRGQRLPDVRREVEAAVGVQPLRTMADRCRKIAGDWSRKAEPQPDEPTAEALRKEEAMSRAEMERRGNGLAAEREQRDTFDQERAKLSEQLRSLGSDDETEPADELREELTQARAELEHHSSVLRASLPEVLPLALLAAPIADLLTDVGTHERWRDHPERARGAREAADHVAKAVAASQLDWARAIPAEQALAELLTLLGLDQDDQREELHVLLRRAEAARRALPGEDTLDAIDRLPGLIDDLKRRLAASSTRHGDKKWRQEFDALLARRDELARRVQELEQSIRDDEIAEEDARERAETAGRAAAAAEKVERKRAVQSTRSSVATAASRALDELADEFRGRRIAAMERAASDMLRSIAHKQHLNRIEIDRETLRYVVLDADGRQVPPDPSTGERMLLALALVHGLRRASGLRFPLFVEAPLKGLDAIHQDQVLRQFLLQVRGQTILLVKPGEIPRSAMHLVGEQVGERFCITQPIEGQDVSTVERGPLLTEAAT